MTRPALLACLFTAAVAAAAPPRVVESIPPHGATDVDPDLTELRLVFDQPMRGGASWTGGGPAFPPPTGRNGWIDDRTNALPVDLAPGTFYTFGINGRRFSNFQATDGTPAVPDQILFRTAGGEPLATIEPARRPEIASAVRTAVLTRYAYRDRLSVDWPARFDEFAPRFETAENSIQLAATIHDLMRVSEDAHVWIRVEGAQLGVDPRIVVPNIAGQRYEEVVPNLQRRSPVVISGRFDDGIGYLMINSWANEDAQALAVARDVLREFEDAPGLIIDVRANAGGNEDLAQAVAGCFVEQPVVYARQVMVDPDSPTGFAPEGTRVLVPTEDGPRMRRPVCVLTGPVVMSSCEAFVLMMRQVEGCTLVGAPTGGSSGRPMPHDVGGGVTLLLPSWRARDADGRPFEGVGIQPDELVETTPAPGRDPIVERALEILRDSG